MEETSSTSIKVEAFLRMKTTGVETEPGPNLEMASVMFFDPLREREEAAVQEEVAVPSPSCGARRPPGLGFFSSCVDPGRGRGSVGSSSSLSQRASVGAIRGGLDGAGGGVVLDVVEQKDCANRSGFSEALPLKEQWIFAGNGCAGSAGRSRDADNLVAVGAKLDLATRSRSGPSGIPISSWESLANNVYVDYWESGVGSRVNGGSQMLEDGALIMESDECIQDVCGNARLDRRDDDASYLVFFLDFLIHWIICWILEMILEKRKMVKVGDAAKSGKKKWLLSL